MRRRGLLVLSRPELTWPGVTAAIVGPGIATGIGLAAGLQGQPGVGALYLAAVAVAAFAGGFWFGLLASALAFAGYDYFFLEPSNSFRIEAASDAILAAVMFLLCAVVVAQIVERLRAAQRDAESALSGLALNEQRFRSLAREQEAVAELGRLALTGSALTDLFERAVEEIGAILDVRCAEVLEASADRSELVVAAGIGLPEGGVGEERFLVSQETPEGQVLIANKPLLFERGEATQLALPAYLADRDVVRDLVVPIRGAVKPWGVLAAHSSRPDAFPPSDVNFMRGLANVLGAAIQRMDVETALRETTDELEALIDASPLPVVAYDPAGRVTIWNPAAEQVFGWTAEEAIGRILPFVQPEMLDEFHSVRERVLAGRSFTAFETVRQRKDGMLIDVSFSNAPVRDAAGRIRGVVALVNDISERKRTERSLRESEEQLRMALDAAEMGVWTWDVETGSVVWSERLAPIHGLEPGEFDGSFEHYQALIHPDDRAFVLESIEAALEGEAGYDIEFRVVWPDGTVRWIWGQAQVVTDASGKPARMVGLGRDVTDRKQREEALAFMADASETLSSTLDYERTLREVARLAVPRLADCCVVDILGANGDIDQLAVVHVDPAKEALVRELESRFPADPRLEESVVGGVLRSRKPLLVSHVDDDVVKEIAQGDEHLEGLRRLRIGSLLIVPLVVRGQTTGAVTLLAGESGRHFVAEDVEVASDLARHAALSVDNARLYAQRSRIASTLQRSLLPSGLPDVPGIELAARYFPAGEGLEVGGDFYDAFRAGDDSLAIVIGDVCGKGPSAAAVTGLTRHTLRAAALHEASPSRRLSVLNDAVLAAYESGTFCTVADARLVRNGDGAKLTVACGGHPLPVVIHADGTLSEIGRYGSLVGFFEDPEFADEMVESSPVKQFSSIRTGSSRAAASRWRPARSDSGSCYAGPEDARPRRLPRESNRLSSPKVGCSGTIRRSSSCA